MITIIGAGMSGLLAAALDRQSTVLESQGALPSNHSAVLRFRTPRIGEALNLPFRKVRVTKGLWEDGAEVALTPARANRYSTKCVGAIVERSLSKIGVEPADRYIAPPDFIPLMAEMVGDRLHLGVEVHARLLAELDRPLISTIPLPRLLNLLDYPEPFPAQLFQHSKISTVHYTIPGANVFQTIYFTSPATSVYRASITGDALLIEAVAAPEPPSEAQILDVFEAFGISRNLYRDQVPAIARQPLGKITELPPERRKALLGRVTREYGIWSLGRYAIWKNVLLDDVFDDFYRIREMMRLSPYDVLKMQGRGAA